MRATNLTDEQIGELRERARRESGPFTNPAILASDYSHNGEWAAEIIGERGSPAGLTWPEVYLLHIAKQAEPDPPPPPLAAARLQEYRVKEAARRKIEAETWRQKLEEWDALKAALATLGVEVTVRHNYTSHRHVEGYRQGVDHIWLRTSLTFGRLIRKADNVLCYVPSKAKDLDHFPVEGECDDRVPECKICLKTARSIAERLKGGRA